jgi:chitin synthase
MRTPDPFGDEHHEPVMNPSYVTSYTNRTPSPGHPLHSYQLEDNPYAPQGHLPMPSSDRLADQPTVSSFIARASK